VTFISEPPYRKKVIPFARELPNGGSSPPFSALHPSGSTAAALVIGHSQEIRDFLFSLFAAVSIAFLQPADKLLGVTLDLVDIVVGHLSPPAPDVTFHLKPFAFKNVFIHSA